MLCSINPATKETFHKVDELTAEQLEAKLALAQSAYESWREVPLDERVRLMKKAATYLRDNKKHIAEIVTKEVGKTLAASEAEVDKCALACDYYSDNAPKFLAPEKIDSDASESFVRFDPIGAVLAIMPWNFPLWQVFRFATPALMAGNVGLLKHAGNVQLSAAIVEEIFRAAGFPEGVFLNLALESASVEKVIRDPRVKAVTLTGSEWAGSQVAKVAGEELKKTVLELGGSDAFIVLADADLDEAARLAVAGRMQMNAGQSCIAAKRFIIEEPIVEAFTKKLTDELAKLKVGDPMDPATHVGPLCSEKMFNEIARQVEESVAQGAKVVAGGKPGPSEGFFYLPTILTGVTKGMPAYNQEIFGPVLPVIPVKDEAEAVEIANDSPYGLGGSIFSADIEKAKDMARQIESGAVFINAVTKSDPRLPFGGVKKSGYGRELSHYGLREFVNIKTVWIK